MQSILFRFIHGNQLALEARESFLLSHPGASNSAFRAALTGFADKSSCGMGVRCDAGLSANSGKSWLGPPDPYRSWGSFLLVWEQRELSVMWS